MRTHRLRRPPRSMPAEQGRLTNATLALGVQILETARRSLAQFGVVEACEVSRDETIESLRVPGAAPLLGAISDIEHRGAGLERGNVVRSHCGERTRHIADLR